MTKHNTTAKATKQAKADAPAFTGHHEFYKSGYLANWLPEHNGPAPALNLFDVVHAIDAKKRPGHEALHIAMCLRPAGCTVRQFMTAASSGPANNYRRALENAHKVIKVAVLPVPGQGRAYAFKATLTAKGLEMVKAALGKVPAALMPVDGDKPKAPRKRTPKAAPAPVTEPETPVEPQQPAAE